MKNDQLLASPRVFGMEAIALARELDLNVEIARDDGSQYQRLPGSIDAVWAVNHGHAARVSLDIDDAANTVCERFRGLVRGILDKEQTWMALALLCAVQTVIRKYEGK